MIKALLSGVLVLIGLNGCGCSGGERVDSKRYIPIVYAEGTSISLFGLEKLHPFDVKKYDKIYRDLDESGYVPTVHAPQMLSEEDLRLVHTQDYLCSLEDKQMVATYLEAPVIAMIPGLDVRKQVVEPFLLSSGGTLKAARIALLHGAAINLGGGYHHAMPDRGEGFCVIADVPIAIRRLQKEGAIRRALVVDTDIHQGNGTVACLQDDPTTFTFSIHEGEIYPWPKLVGDRDVELGVGVTDDEYLRILEDELPRVIELAQPDIVFHVAGCDALEGDPLANGLMTPEGIAKRDKMIFLACQKRGIPYVMTLSGGYSRNAWKVQSGSIKGLMR